MKTLFKIIYAFMLVSLPASIFAQNVLDDITTDENTPNRNAIPYTSIRQADVMWKKVVWRVIDLRDKINLPLYYPIDSLQGSKSLWDIIRAAIVPNSKDPKHILPGQIPCYQVDINNLDNGFIEMQPSDILPLLSDTIMDPTTGQPMRDNKGNVLVAPTTSKGILQYIVKEVWFFDRQRSVMDVRILGICPVRARMDPKTGSLNYDQQQPMFWVYFPAIRPFFAKSSVFNPENNAERRTLDDIFWKRQFSSYIIEASNVYNRKINSYIGVPVDEQLEGEKVKSKMFNLESDMWQY